MTPAELLDLKDGDPIEITARGRFRGYLDNGEIVVEFDGAEDHSWLDMGTTMIISKLCKENGAWMILNT